MVRKPPSPADEALLNAASQRGLRVTATQLERWRAAGLLPPNARQRPGRGQGSSSTPAPDAVELVVWLAQHARPGQRPSSLALRAFAEELPVPEPTVRKAWRAAIRRIELPGEKEHPPPAGGDRADWAWSLAERAANPSTTVVIPRRMRRIDDRIAAAGISWALPQVAQYDRGPDIDEPVDSRGFATYAAVAALSGGPELTGAAMAPYARAMLPAGAASPTAYWLEHPDGPGRDPSEISNGAGLSLLPTGDIREDLLRTIDESTMAQLRAGWHAAAQMRTWALAQCDAVEAELDTGQLGEATLAWMAGAALGVSRLLIRDVLRDQRFTTTSQVTTAVMLLWMGGALQRLRVLVPDGQFELLPELLPPFLHDLAGVPTSAQDGCP